MTPPNLEISVEDAQPIIATAPSSDVLVLDCRNPDEHAIVHLPDATLIPMDEIPARVAELQNHRQKQIIIYCHLGMRSKIVAQWLRENAFPYAQSLAGGIDAWSVQVDPSLPRY